ncbi:MAG: hypothetical protein DRO11_04780 [Methanobacteriota archaeon]|nr:MAG: hypothetical protein DRO11_04780 [Euryarchaeota archaeon]
MGKAEFLVDSGAVYSVVPKKVLEKLGIKPLAEQEFRLANGSNLVTVSAERIWYSARRVTAHF